MEVPVGFVSFLAGVFFMGVVMDHSNRSYEPLSKVKEICNIFESEPEWFDYNGELVCENGVTVNYRTFGE